MKKLYTLALAALCCAPLSAQVMKIHCGQVTTLVPASEVAEYSIDAGVPALVAGELKFPFSDIDSVTFSRNAWTPLNVAVKYAGETATVELGYDVAANAKVSISGADVSILQDSLFFEEVSYTLSGQSANGSFYNDGEYKAGITLNGLDLTSQKGAAIQIDNGKRINVFLPEGSDNRLADAADGLHKACFFINGHAEFSGAGSLTLTGNTKHAYASDEYTWLEADAGKISVLSAKGDGLHVEQYFQMDGGEIDVKNALGDGIDVSITKDPLDALNGQAIINGGKITLDIAAEDVKGLKSDSLLSILGGIVDIKVSGNGSKGISASTDMIIGSTTGGPNITVNATGTTYMPNDALLSSKCMGIRVKVNLDVYGGTTTVTNSGANSRGIKVDGNYAKHGGTVNGTVDW